MSRRRWGIFISFEGVDGVGKTTLVKSICHRMVDDGHKFVATREPGGSPISEQIRAVTKNPDFDAMDYRTEALLMLAARAQLVHHTYRPALIEGGTVVADRYIDSTFAYQGFGRGLELEVLKTLNGFATEGLMPDRTYLLDAPLEVISQRINQRGQKEDRLDSQKSAFFRQVQQGYMQLAQADPERFVIIDATQSPQDMAEQVYQDYLATRHQLLSITT